MSQVSGGHQELNVATQKWLEMMISVNYPENMTAVQKKKKEEKNKKRKSRVLPEWRTKK